MKKRNEIDNILQSIHLKKLSSTERAEMFSSVVETYERASGKAVVYQNSENRSTSQQHFGGRISLYRKVIVGAIIFGLTSATAYASNESVPGDFLFPLDRAMESVQLGLVSGENDARLRVKIAKERLDEVDVIILRSVVKEEDEGNDVDDNDDTATSSKSEKWYSSLSDDDVRRAGEGLSIALGMLDDAADDVDENDSYMKSTLESFNTRAGAVVDSQSSSKVRVRIEEEDDNDDTRVRVRVEEKVQDDGDESTYEKVRIEVKSGRIRVQYENDNKDREHEDDEDSRNNRDDDSQNIFEDKDDDSVGNSAAAIFSNSSQSGDDSDDDEEEFERDSGNKQESRRGRD